LTDLVGVGNGSYLSDLVDIAGGVNVLGGPGLPEYPRISMETIIRLAPDVIVDAGDMGDTPEDRLRRQAATLQLWNGQTALTAAAGMRFIRDERWLAVPPRVVEVANTLALGRTNRDSAIASCAADIRMSDRLRSSTASLRGGRES
jgi:iron complex transport system substrate-binding protein